MNAALLDSDEEKPLAALTNNERKSRMLLGIAIMEATLPPGPRTYQTIAAFCGCSFQAIQRLERRAMRKLRSRAASWQFQLSKP